MDLYVFFSADDVDELIQHLIIAENTDGLAKLSFSICRADDLFHNWAIGTGGKTLFYHGGEGIVCLDASRVDELPIIKAEYNQLVGGVSIGVGSDLMQAKKSAKYAKDHGGNQIVLFSPEMEPDQEIFDAELTKKEQELPIHKKPELPVKGAEDSSALEQEEGNQEEEESSPNSADTKEQIKQMVMEVLSQVKDNMQGIEQIKQTDPAAYESIRAIIEAMIIMAESLVEKSESESNEDSEGEPESKDEEEVPEGLDKAENPASPTPPKSPKASKHGAKRGRKARVALGTIKGSKVKIRYPDGSYRWVSIHAAAKHGARIKKSDEVLDKSVRKLYIGSNKPKMRGLIKPPKTSVKAPPPPTKK